MGNDKRRIERLEMDSDALEEIRTAEYWNCPDCGEPRKGSTQEKPGPCERCEMDDWHGLYDDETDEQRWERLIREEKNIDRIT